MIVIILFALLLIVLILISLSEVQFLRLREKSLKMRAQVIEYRKEKGPMRGDYTKIDYPYVKILTEGPYKDKIIRLKYARSSARPFEIGQMVDVFFAGENLLYWNAMDFGLAKHLPKKWTNINSPEKE